MILALYPQFADADAVTQTRLIGAWFRRKRLEARLIAMEVGKFSAVRQAQRPITRWWMKARRWPHSA